MAESMLAEAIAPGASSHEVKGVPTPLILFDGVCNLCSWSVQFLAPRDRCSRLWFAAVQSATGQAILRQHGIPTEDWDSFVLVDAEGVWFKSAAFFRTVPYMTQPWPLLRIFRVVPRGLADWLYDRIARNRYAVFGRKPSCMIPRPERAARFLP
jgi:predicted DCC family thiol-disulfide oxidoreductase YuxK